MKRYIATSADILDCAPQRVRHYLLAESSVLSVQAVARSPVERGLLNLRRQLARLRDRSG